MNRIRHSSAGLKVALLLAAMIFATLACSFGGVTMDGNTATIDVTLNEDQVNQLFKSIDFQNDTNEEQWMDKITGVEMHDGVIRVLGSDTMADGTEINGSFDLSVTAENDMLKVQIVDVSIPGVDLNDPRIIEANQKMSEALTRTVTEANGEVKFKEAAAMEDALKLKVQVGLNSTR